MTGWARPGRWAVEGLGWWGELEYGKGGGEKGRAGGWFRWVVQSLYAVRCGGVGWGVVVSKALVGLGFCRLCVRCGG